MAVGHLYPLEHLRNEREGRKTRRPTDLSTERTRRRSSTLPGLGVERRTWAGGRFPKWQRGRRAAGPIGTTRGGVSAETVSTLS